MELHVPLPWGFAVLHYFEKSIEERLCCALQGEIYIMTNIAARPI